MASQCLPSVKILRKTNVNTAETRYRQEASCSITKKPSGNFCQV